MNPKYPIYIISKGRWESRLTAKALDKMNVSYHIVVEPQEYDNYAKVIDKEKIYVLPFSNLGQGSIPARNWVWEHSISMGAERHWVIDDNIQDFYRLHKNINYHLKTGAGFRVIEDFVDRYENFAMAGMQYEGLTLRNAKKKSPFILNTRIYSIILLKNDLPQRWRGRYNEDTDLSLRFLKAGYCTILFYIFNADKVATLRMKGGNTDSVYADTNNRLEFAQSLQRQHPDVVKVVWKYNRWHHQVDYRPFKNNKPILKKRN